MRPLLALAVAIGALTGVSNASGTAVTRGRTLVREISGDVFAGTIGLAASNGVFATVDGTPIERGSQKERLT